MPEPIRIAYLVNSYVPGGVKTLLTNYSSHLDSERFTVDFIVCEDPYGTCASDMAEKGRAIVVGSIVNPVRYMRRCERALRDGKYDIVQACMNSLNVFPLVAARRAGVPVRLSYSLSSSHPSERNTVAKSALKKLSTVGVTHRAANCRLSGEWLFGKDADFRIIPNTYSSSVYYQSSKEREETRARYGWDGCMVIGHIGRFQPQKNHAFLIDIFSELHKMNPDTKLALVGHGPLKSATMEKIDSLGLADNVTDLGSTEDLNGLYNAFDCFVLPSLYEGMPVVGIEAQAVGCPCVFSSEITREAKVNENVSFTKLDSPIIEWATALERASNMSRVVNEALAKYEIKTAAADLANWYESLRGEQIYDSAKRGEFGRQTKESGVA